VFRQENDEEIVDQLPGFENLNELYNQIQLIYEAEFSRMDYDQVDDYDNTSTLPLIATSLPDLLVELTLEPYPRGRNIS
jgi:hypothetical protein